MARVVAVGVAHHITQRGNHQQEVFYTPDDRLMYLDLLRENCGRCGLEVMGYCLMGNHVHLVAVPKKADSLARAVGHTHNDYARWMNIRRHQVGHLWQNRFYSCPLDPQHTWEALRYVELNPVRAGLAAEAWAWPWSSAAFHVGAVRPPAWVNLSEWAQCWNAERWRFVLEQGFAELELIERLREATRNGRPFGREQFVVEMEQAAGRVLRRGKPGPKPKEAARERANSGVMVTVPELDLGF
jgi:putative transposase